MKANKFTLLFCLICLLFPLRIMAQDYNISYKKQSIESVITDLRKKTGYEFVYQKHILNDLPEITCTYKNVTIEQILDRIFYSEAELDYMFN